MVRGARRAGFSLVEVLAALVLLGVAGLVFSAGSTWSARLLASAERTERAQELAMLVLDSLAQSPAPGSGEATLAGVRVRWTAAREAGGAARVELRFVAPAAVAVLPPLVQVVGPTPPTLRVVSGPP